MRVQNLNEPHHLPLGALPVITVAGDFLLILWVRCSKEEGQGQVQTLGADFEPPHSPSLKHWATTPKCYRQRGGLGKGLPLTVWQYQWGRLLSWGGATSSPPMGTALCDASQGKWLGGTLS